MADDTLNSQAEAMKPTDWKGIRSIFPTEFQDALANNCPPRPWVLQTARAFRENPALAPTAAKKRIEAIDQQMKMLQAERDQLANEDSMRAAIAEACATVCAPSRRLPRDILHEIFSHSIPKYPASCKSNAPINLSHVSSTWRSIALLSPRLWTSLYLRIEAIDYRSLMKYVQVVNSWFSRTATLPINLFLYVDDEIESDGNQAYNFNLLLKSITPWTSRVARLGIGGEYWINLMAQFAGIEWNLCNMHTLEILGQRSSEKESIDNDMAQLQAVGPRITLFQNSGTTFTTLIANQEITSYLAAFSFIPWQTLTSVDIDECLSSQIELSKLLILCPQLRSASLQWLEEGSDLIAPPVPFLIDELEHLTLNTRPWVSSALPRFFSVFTFPSLTHLTITNNELDVEVEATPTFGFIPAFPSLTFLEFEAGFPIPYVLSFLQSTRKLRTFVIGHCGLATDLNGLFESLIVTNAQYNFLPLLEECLIQIVGETIVLDTSTISRFMHSRTLDLPSNFTSFRKLTLMGEFSCLSDLHEEAARISDLSKTPMEINMPFDSDNPSDHVESIKHPEPFFADALDGSGGYARLVRHELWLT